MMIFFLPNNSTKSRIEKEVQHEQLTDFRQSRFRTDSHHSTKETEAIMVKDWVVVFQSLEIKRGKLLIKAAE